jgi:hypothetical protein
MKARYIREARALNPAFSNKAKRAARKAGQPYVIEPYITIPVGFEEEGPHCWTHCCPGYKGEDPVCEPADDECRVRVEQWMKVERPKQLERIRQMAHPKNLAKMSKAQREHVKDLAASYGLTPPSENDPVQKMEPVGPMSAVKAEKAG